MARSARKPEAAAGFVSCDVNVAVVQSVKFSCTMSFLTPRQLFLSKQNVFKLSKKKKNWSSVVQQMIS